MIEQFSNLFGKPANESAALCHQHSRIWAFTREIPIWLERANDAYRQLTDIALEKIRLEGTFADLKETTRVAGESALKALRADRLIEADNWIADIADCKLKRDTVYAKQELLEKTSVLLDEFRRRCLHYTSELQEAVSLLRSKIAFDMAKADKHAASSSYLDNLLKNQQEKISRTKKILMDTETELEEMTTASLLEEQDILENLTNKDVLKNQIQITLRQGSDITTLLETS